MPFGYCALRWLTQRNEVSIQSLTHLVGVSRPVAVDVEGALRMAEAA